jgi:3-methyladenine DNA glycosylase Tag
MTYEEANLFLSFLWNKVDRKLFGEILEKAIGHGLEERYIDEKWEHFQRCPAHFVQGFREFFEATITAMEAIDYKG